MGKLDILTKLRSKFTSVPEDEEDVIFILTRVRKVLDQDNHGINSKYGILRFYCNLALHFHIENVPNELGEELRNVHDNQSPWHPFYGYNDLHTQLQGFIQEHNLPNFYENSSFNGQRFVELLNSIYSDVPVTVGVVKKYQVVVNQDGTITGNILEA
jgi:hypothetical protein